MAELLDPQPWQFNPAEITRLLGREGIKFPAEIKRVRTGPYQHGRHRLRCTDGVTRHIITVSSGLAAPLAGLVLRHEIRHARQAEAAWQKERPYLDPIDAWELVRCSQHSLRYRDRPIEIDANAAMRENRDLVLIHSDERTAP